MAFRTEDLDAACGFYEDVMGLPVMDRDEISAFFELGPGYGGHIDVLALFDRTATDGYDGISASEASRGSSDQRSDGVSPAHTTLDHVAFQIDREDGEARSAS